MLTEVLKGKYFPFDFIDVREVQRGSMRSGIAEESFYKACYCCGVVRSTHVEGEIMGALKVLC